MKAKVFYVEEWTTEYKIHKVKADSKEHALEFYWDEGDERVEVIVERDTDSSETKIYEEKDKEKLCGWNSNMIARSEL